MPDETDFLLKDAESAIKYARDVRNYHRKRTKKGDVQREADLRHALERLRLVMKPIRSVIGRAQFEAPSTARAERQKRVRAASTSIQVERRKLWKMTSEGVT